MNRSDLHAYQSGVDKMQNLIPGIRSKVQPFAQSQLSHAHAPARGSPHEIDKERWLRDQGYRSK